MVLSFTRGGDLRYHLDENRGIMMKENTVRFYIAEIILALEEMHSLNIVYRDLKPENCLLDSDGHVRLSDFGLACRLDLEPHGKTSGQCGTTGFMAPEMMAGFEYDTCVDIYSLGVIMYELLHDRFPDLTLGSSNIALRSDLSDEAQDLLMGLLQLLPDERLGCTTEYKIEEIKMHPWFKNIDWEAASRRELIPPFKPDSNIANCDPSFELEEQLLDSPIPRRITPEQDAQFIGWEHNVEIHHTSDGEQITHKVMKRNEIRRSSGTLIRLMKGTKSLRDDDDNFNSSPPTPAGNDRDHAFQFNDNSLQTGSVLDDIELTNIELTENELLDGKMISSDDHNMTHKDLAKG